MVAHVEYMYIPLTIMRNEREVMATLMPQSRESRWEVTEDRAHMGLQRWRVL